MRAVVPEDTTVELDVTSSRRRAGWIAGFSALAASAMLLGLPLERLAHFGRWFLSNISDAQYYAHLLPSLGLLAGASLAHWASMRGMAWRGFPLGCGSGLWPWMVTSSLLGLLLSNLFWGWTLRSGDWQPTFVCFVSLPAVTVLLYGAGWKTFTSGAFLGALLVTPLSLLAVNVICRPLGWPLVVGNALGMAFGTAAGCWLLNRCAWQRALPKGTSSFVRAGRCWGLRRVLADFSEAPFFGNEWASAGLIGGALLAYWLEPGGSFNGTGWLPGLLAAQALASGLGVWLWRRQWAKRGWYPTFVPLVSVVPAAILTHGPGWPVIVLSATCGAVIAPPLAVAISSRLPAYVHCMVGNVASMAISTLLIVPCIGLAVEATAKTF